MSDGNPWSGLSAEVFLVLAGNYRREAQLRVDAPVDPACRPRRGGKRRLRRVARRRWRPPARRSLPSVRPERSPAPLRSGGAQPDRRF
ncbi:hypothetical protein RPHASCH2410_PC01830 (plasmid) [Rhizobium phaseoli Ch24-10]|nr:hypothetical protein RPHASCH2410_PC01830 [Rhizobium phaseoli Ch24-10]